MRVRALLASAQSRIAADKAARSVTAVQTCAARARLPAVTSRAAHAAPPSHGSRATHATPLLPSFRKAGTAVACTGPVRDHRGCTPHVAITATQPPIRRCLSTVHATHVAIAASSVVVHRCHSTLSEHGHDACHHTLHEGECTHHRREAEDGQARPGQGQGKPSKRVWRVRKL